VAAVIRPAFVTVDIAWPRESLPPYQISAEPLVCVTSAVLGLTHLAVAPPHRKITSHVS